MRRCPRIDVGKGVAVLVLIKGLRGDASINDLAEEAAHNGSSVQEGSENFTRTFGPIAPCGLDAAIETKALPPMGRAGVDLLPPPKPTELPISASDYVFA